MAFSFGQPAAGASSASPFSFGSTSAAPTTAAPAAPSFSFGQTSTAAPAAGAPAAGGFSFGGFGQSTATSQPAQPATAGGFSFGAPATTSTSTLSFGAPATTAPSFSFGQPAATTSSTFSFGQPAAAPASNLFGQSSVTAQPFSFSQPAQANTGGLFGSTAAAPNPFGASQPAFGASTATLGQSQQQAGPPAVPSIQDKLQALQAAWHPQSPVCRFQSYFYNVVDSSQVNMYGRPPLMRDALYQKAKRESPDPEKRAVVLTSSFDDVKRRVDAQTQMATTHFAKLNELSAEIKKRSAERIEPALTRLQRASHAQVKLCARLMAVIAQLHPLTPRRGTPLRSDEEKLANEIDALQADFSSGPARLPAQLNELWVKVASRKAAAQGHTGAKAGETWEVASEEELNKLLEVVDQQQRSLDFLTKTLVEDLAAINVVRTGFGLQKA